MSLSIATWNVNSIRAREDHVLAWLAENPVDILALQETKTPDEHFPESLTKLSYHLYRSGQKSYNGVAIFCREPALTHQINMHPDHTVQKRFLHCTFPDFHVINLYIPNGSSLDSDKYTYKLNWLDACYDYLQALQQQDDRPVIIVGDFNIAPTDQDVHDPVVWQDRILVSPPERAWFKALLAMGFRDSYRYCHPESDEFSWWDYRAAGFRRNLGLRIDFVMCSETLTIESSNMDKEERRKERPSDHIPVVTHFTLPCST